MVIKFLIGAIALVGIVYLIGVYPFAAMTVVCLGAIFALILKDG